MDVWIYDMYTPYHRAVFTNKHYSISAFTSPFLHLSVSPSPRITNLSLSHSDSNSNSNSMLNPVCPVLKVYGPGLPCESCKVARSEESYLAGDVRSWLKGALCQVRAGQVRSSQAKSPV
jgi:hypothetical protein